MELSYSHNIIEHLGIKLYQNKPTNVLAELVSNSWDAYAKNTFIDIYKDEKYIAIFDDGYGMTYKELNENYLIIGKHKRTNKDDDKQLDKKYDRLKNIGYRGPMGRKGIGKLAPFGISKLITLITVSLEDNGNNKVTWIELDLEEMIKENDKPIKSYTPNIILDNVDYSKDVLLDFFKESETFLSVHPNNKIAVEKFTDKIEQSGTLILLNNLSLKKTLNSKNIIESMGRRFTVTLLKDDFNVHINNNKVDTDSALPDFEFRVPLESGFLTEQLDGKDVKFWAGFVETAEWSADEAGVGVYAHGKIAQERPFTFKIKGREIHTRYMYAVIEADWLDELSDDVISTDRTSINWEAEELQNLHTWGQQKVSEWIKSFEKFKADKNKDVIDTAITTNIKSDKIPKITKAEQSLMTDMLSDIYLDLGKQEGAKEKLLIATANAWTHKPMKDMVKKLWDGFKKEELNGKGFGEIIEKLNDYAVPESLSLSVTFAQKAYALNLLYEQMHKGREIDLQKLIETFPWILKPEMELLTANQTLKTMVLSACEKGLSPDRYQHTISNDVGVNGGKKPDFVFLSDGAETEFSIIEIKHPSQEITIDNREQLNSYMTYLESKYPSSPRKGILIGNNTNKIYNNNPNQIEFVTWDEIFRRSRALHISYLTSMIKASASEITDGRMKDIVHFGGEETLELISKIGENSIEMKDLIEEFSQLGKK